MHILNLPGAGAQGRACYHEPDGPSLGTCLIVQSGLMGRFDEPGAAQECELYAALVARLKEVGIGALQLDLPRRANAAEPASAEHLAARTALVRQLWSQLPALLPSGPLVFCGVSLGAQTVMQLVADIAEPFVVPVGVLLIGAVLERRCIIAHGVHAIHLVYGSDDYIGYVSRDAAGEEQMVAIGPNEYAGACAQMLALHAAQICGVHILSGLDHTLAPSQGTADADWTAPQVLTDLIVNMLCPGAPASNGGER